MPKAIVSRDNTNLAKSRPGKGGQRTVVSEVVDNIKDVTDMMREKNNIIIGTQFRLDARKMAKAEALKAEKAEKAAARGDRGNDRDEDSKEDEEE